MSLRDTHIPTYIFFALLLTMADREYTYLPFYGSNDPEEYLEWVQDMELELEPQKFESEAKEVRVATMFFKDYASSWWQQLSGKRFITSWVYLKRAMRREFVPSYYERELLHHVESITQGCKVVQDYYIELNHAMRRANITSAYQEKTYFKAGLNFQIVVALQDEYFRSLQDLVKYATKAEKRLKDMQAHQLNLRRLFSSYSSTSVSLEKKVELGNFSSAEVVVGGCAIASPRSCKDEMYQNPCEDESHIAKLSESDKKSELCDSTICKVESIPIEYMRDTPKEKREIDERPSKIIFEPNNLPSISSVVSHIVQADQANKELNIQEPPPLEEKDEEITMVGEGMPAALGLHDDITIPTTPTLIEEDDQGNTVGTELIVHQDKVRKTENSVIPFMIPRSKFDMLNLHNVELITQKEVLSRIFLNDSLCYIIFNKPKELSSVIKKVPKNSYLRSLVNSYIYTYKFNLIGDVGVDNMFQVYRICITCDNLADLKLHVLRKPSITQCDGHFEKGFNTSAYCLEHNIMPTCLSLTCITNQSNTVEEWKGINWFSPTLLKFHVGKVKFDHMSQLCNLKYDFELSIVQNNKKNTIIDSYIYHVYTLFFLSSTFSGYQKPRTAFLEEREDDVDILSYVVPYSVFNSTSTSEQHELTKRVEEQEKLLGEVCAKKLNRQVNLFHEFPLSLIENIILPNSGSSLIVRFEGDALCEYQEHDASRGVHDDLCSNSKGSSMNNIYIWKAYQVYFPTDQMARDLELSIKSYGYSSACCTFRPTNARELTKLMIPWYVRRLGKIFNFAMTFQRLTRVPFSSFIRIQVVSINEIEVRKVWIKFGFGISIKIGFGISSTVRIKKVITFTN